MNDELSDQQLIASSIDRPEQFGEVFDRYYDEIRRFAWRRLGEEHADDLAAEVFARAFKGREKFDCVLGDARPWLFGIASNLIRMQARGEKRKLRAYARTGIDPFEDFAAAATERASASGDRRVLLDALAGLKRADREVVLLHAWGDLTTNEIASALGVPHATVRTKLARSRKRLASELSNLEPADSAPPTEILKETI